MVSRLKKKAVSWALHEMLTIPAGVVGLELGKSNLNLAGGCFDLVVVTCVMGIMGNEAGPESRSFPLRPPTEAIIPLLGF